MSYVGLSPPGTGEIRSFPFPERYRPLKEGVSDEELGRAYLERLAVAIESLKSDGPGFAALIVCPIFANEGVPEIPSGFMRRATEWVHREGGLVIADEVQSGYGRSGQWWGYESSEFQPDIVVGGKPMGNGLPLGATAAKKDFIDTFRAEKDYFNTCAASPLQAAVGMAVLDEIERLDLINNAADVGASLLSELRQRVDRYDAIGDARGSGLFLSVEMVRDKSSKEPDRDLALSLSDRLKDKGFLVSYSGKYENVLKLRPPLVFSHANADEFMVAFDECMEEIHG
jgi:4-aminobutyrate aminotransferase-like enzyme